MTPFELWSAGCLLNEAATKYQRRGAKYADNRTDAAGVQQSANDNLPNLALGEALFVLGEMFNASVEAARAPKTALVEKLKTGKLAAYGYMTPREIRDAPQRVPKDLFYSPKIDWERSTVSGAGLAFVSVRVAAGRLARGEADRSRSQKGRPSYGAEIRDAIKALRRKGQLGETLGRKAQTDIVRSHLMALHPNRFADGRGLSDETIRTRLMVEFSKPLTASVNSP